MKTLLNNKIKSLTIAAMLLTTIATASGVAAATQYPGGGVWTYGAANGGAYSNYYHGSRYHSSTVVSRRIGASSKGYAGAGQTSRAWINTNWGERVAFYYNY